MSEKRPLLHRLKDARAVQILTVYLGVSWAVLQLVGTLKELLELPSWIGPITVVLLGIGLVVVGATAWVQSLESTTKAEEAGDVPTDWEIDPAGALESLKAGRLPHLTWGRAVLGGVVAIALTLGAAGAYVVIRASPGLLGPVAVGASGVTDGIAVLPFDVTGDDAGLYREGMVRMLSANLEGIGGLRAIDSRTVLARWDEEVGGATRVDLDASLRAAGGTGARYAVLGTLVPAGATVRADVDIYDLADGSKLGSTRVDGSLEEVFALVDGLTVGVARALLGTQGEQDATRRQLESITTSDVSALKEYLEGEGLHRLGDFEAAQEAFRRAVATDSTFALAWSRLAASLGWGGTAAEADDARARAVALIDRLAPREVLLLRTSVAFHEGNAEAIDLLESYVARYPDDAEAWHRLGDSYYHMAVDHRGEYPSSRAQAWDAFRRAVELDPGFAPYWIHIVDFAFAAGDSAAAREAMERYRGIGGSDNQFTKQWAVGFDILFGDSAAMQAGIAAALELDSPDDALGLVGDQVGVDRVPRELALKRAIHRMEGSENSLAELLLTLWRAGRWQESQEILARQDSDLTPLLAAGVRAGWLDFYGLGELAALGEALSRATCTDECLALEVQRMVYATRVGDTAGIEAARSTLDTLTAETLAFLESMSGKISSGGMRVLVRVVTDVEADALAEVDLIQGRPEAVLEAFRANENGIFPYLMGARAADQVDDFPYAERYYLATNWGIQSPFATYRLAKMYERMGGRDADALAQYGRLAIMWSEADDDFQPWVEVQEALTRLGR